MATPDATHNYAQSWGRAKVEGYQERPVELHKWPVQVTVASSVACSTPKLITFRRGPIWRAPPAALAKEAEQVVLARAGEMLARTERHAV